MTKLAFLDTKTTGLNSDIHDMWELSFIVREEGAPRDSDAEHFFQFAVQGLEMADPISLKINEFWTRYEPVLLARTTQDKPRPETAVARSLSVAVDEAESAWTFISHKQAALEITTLLADATVVGSNPGFDMDHTAGFLTKYVTDHGFPASWASHSLDVFALTYGFVLSADEHVYDRSDLRPDMNRTQLYRKVLGVVPPQQSALAVARTVRDVWDFVN